MNALKIWAISVCAALFSGAIVSFLAPKKNFQNVMKLSLSAFFICALILPVWQKADYTNAKTNVFLSSEAQNENSAFELSLVNVAAQQLKEQIKTSLNQKHFHYEEINVSMNIQEQLGIGINEIVISGVPKNQMQKVHDFLKDKFGYEAVIR